MTPEGRSKIEAVLPDHIQNIQQGLSILTGEEKEDLIQILKNLKI
ncbi:transcriptional regulator, MarR family [Streptococcus constellatus subsp. pharyngis SK1060 = CCUG 46377]|uniref:Transcriptional regulator, MarR family n=1 Tax=Streptococcus constellatus subsp. pharyngis SK1060 = CCUG 46377 TaxID=1035184 RepID=F9P6D1_STRCV|nr:transcriptional regulator, MarR family [Streptococcus constellatus subsp. pharyngis SK1060 = CCUG 46377]